MTIGSLIAYLGLTNVIGLALVLIVFRPQGLRRGK
jgi:hypothetical protein